MTYSPVLLVKDAPLQVTCNGTDYDIVIVLKILLPSARHLEER